MWGAATQQPPAKTRSAEAHHQEQRPAQLGEGAIHRETGLDSLSVCRRHERKTNENKWEEHPGITETKDRDMLTGCGVDPSLAPGRENVDKHL